MPTSFQTFYDETHELALLREEPAKQHHPTKAAPGTSLRRLLFGLGAAALGLAAAVAPLL